MRSNCLGLFRIWFRIEKKGFLLLFIFGFVGSYLYADDITKFNRELYTPEKFSKSIFEMMRQPDDIAYQYFLNGASHFISNGDTVNYLQCIAKMSVIEMQQGNFNQSFDLLWNAFPVAEKISIKKPLVEMHHMLGILYGIYKKDSIALSHTKKAHNTLLSSLKTKVKKDSLVLISSYLDVAVRYIEMKQFDDALIYLDSCYLFSPTKERLPFVDVNYGLVFLRTNNTTKAKAYLNGIDSYFVAMKSDYQAAVYYYLGDLKVALNQMDSSIYYYKKSLGVIEKLRSHVNLKPVILENLANSYRKVNDYANAYKTLSAAKSVSDSLFNTQSEQNSELFEIKNKYKEDLVKKEDYIINQDKLLELNSKVRIRLIIIIGILILLVGIGILTFRLKLRMKHMAYEQKIVSEKSNAVLEVKNKELTSNALQIIEQKQAVKEILDVINEIAPDKFKNLHSKYRQNNKKIWDDFNLRFSQTNNTFYDSLLELHPSLTPTDLKHCALIKLNFDSKEMSHLLGISISSVHMARFRIRKKLNMRREDSLSGYLVKVG